MLSINNSELNQILATGKLFKDEKLYDFFNPKYGDNTIVINDVEITESFYSQNALKYLTIFEKVTTNYDISFYMSQLDEALHIRGGNYQKLIMGANTKKGIYFFSGQAKSLEFNTGIIEHIHIYDFTVRSLTCINTRCSDFSLEGGNIDYINLTGDQNEFKSIHLFGGEFKYLQLAHGKIDSLLVRRNIQSSSAIFLNDIFINKLWIADTSNYGKIVLNNIKPFGDKSSIEIENSVLGSFDIISSDLTPFSFLIYSSKLIDIFYTNTRFPESFLTKGKNKYRQTKQLIDIYEQLSVVASKKGDRSNSIYFQARSLSFLFGIMPKYSTNWWILYSNKVSNNFRQSWRKAVIFTFIISVVFFIPFILLIDHSIEWGYFFNIHGYFEVFQYLLKNRSGQIFEFMNPVHKISDFNKDNMPISFAAYFIDYMGRAFIGFGIYQTIQAFRKYGKSGD